jgi:hypothetical protein
MIEGMIGANDWTLFPSIVSRLTVGTLRMCDSTGLSNHRTPLLRMILPFPQEAPSSSPRPPLVQLELSRVRNGQMGAASVRGGGPLRHVRGLRSSRRPHVFISPRAVHRALGRHRCVNYAVCWYHFGIVHDSEFGQDGGESRCLALGYFQ